ncbi:MAG: FecR family protein [Spirochaetia bacterium]|jgi:ferric-dicitrate binding protein FerR (iron transport regulator)|nr:FecR family protein [Spirochaetia bacterium]
MRYGKRILVSAFALCAAFFFTQSLAAQEEKAVLREVRGNVEIKAPGAAAWVKATAGDRVEKNTLVSTGFQSSALLVVGDSLITLRPLTRLSVEEILRSQGGERVELRLQTGRMRAEVRPPAGGKTDFTVRSPMATASVRGTTFEFDTQRIRVEEGRVAYSLAAGGRRGRSVGGGGAGYVDEVANTVVSPFTAAAELLTPAPPVGSASGGPQGDNAPTLTPSGADVGLGFAWE